MQTFQKIIERQNINTVKVVSALKDKNSLFESGSSKKSGLIGLCDVWE